MFSSGTVETFPEYVYGFLFLFPLFIFSVLSSFKLKYIRLISFSLYSIVFKLPQFILAFIVCFVTSRKDAASVWFNSPSSFSICVIYHDAKSIFLSLFCVFLKKNQFFLI